MEQGTNSPRVWVASDLTVRLFPEWRSWASAPFNVAWHLAGLGAKPLLISRIGHDPCGDAVLAGMRDWCTDVSGIQMDTQAPTGQVQIALTGTDHSFTILSDQAYDQIATEPALAAVAQANPALLYCGSLITRNPIAHDTLIALRRATIAPSFIGINLRAPW